MDENITDIQKALEPFTDSELSDELTRRVRIRAAARKAERAGRVCCDNCAHKAKGYTSSSSYLETFVCRKRPKDRVNTKGWGAPIRAYFACSPKYINNCEFFERKKALK